MTQEEKKRWIRGHWLSLDKKLLTTALKRYWGVDKDHIRDLPKMVSDDNAEIMRELLNNTAGPLTDTC